MVEQIAETGERQRQKPRWERRYYPSTEGTPDAECFVVELPVGGGLPRVVKSVCTPSRAAAMVKAHNAAAEKETP